MIQTLNLIKSIDPDLNEIQWTAFVNTLNVWLQLRRLIWVGLILVGLIWVWMRYHWSSCETINSDQYWSIYWNSIIESVPLKSVIFGQRSFTAKSSRESRNRTEWGKTVGDCPQASPTLCSQIVLTGRVHKQCTRPSKIVFIEWNIHICQCDSDRPSRRINGRIKRTEKLMNWVLI